MKGRKNSMLAAGQPVGCCFGTRHRAAERLWVAVLKRRPALRLGIHGVWGNEARDATMAMVVRRLTA
jgi:hypothetical protein